MPGETRDAYLRRVHNISEVEWNAVLEFQGGGCFGCDGEGVTRSLHTDHSHRTRLLRGILCVSCNVAVRRMKDDPVIAENLSLYLEDPPAVHVIGERLSTFKRKRVRRP